MNIFTFMKQCFMSYSFKELKWSLEIYDDFKSISFYEDIETFVLTNYFFEKSFRFKKEIQESYYPQTVKFMRKYVL